MKKRNLIRGVMLVLSLAATHHVEAQDNSVGSAVESKHTEKALNILSGMTQFIETAQAFVVKGTFGSEQFLENGQPIEYGTNFTAIFNRPLQLKFLLSSRDGSEATMIFDGETITVVSLFEDQHIYDTTSQPGDVTESLDFVARQTGGPRELENFLSEELTKSLDKVRSGISLGKSTIDGVLCTHLAVRSDAKDGQVWVARGDEPAPWRILMTHRDKPGQPRFWVQFDEWDFSPDISENTFRYTPPEGAVEFHYFLD